jgi:hypothetical protein
MVEFQAWPKTPRLFRDMTVTEKIDGTNAAIHITPGVEVSNAAVFDAYPLKPGEVWDGEQVWHVTAQSRKRIVVPSDDNYGFAGWVHANAVDLISLLGPGLHFGEWWGRGIQRRYGMYGRAFSLFNTDRHADVKAVVGDVAVEPVPVLYRGPFDTARVAAVLAGLREFGSVAAPGFADPEGVCVFHHATRQVYKATLDNNDAGKWEALAS